ncbi:MAG: hypothetical protein RR235_07970 [Oscillospiraceae bacterium]
MNKYEQLTEDLKAAVESTASLEWSEDGGTCNFDAPILILPRWQEEKVQAAAKAAGCGAWMWPCRGNKCFIISIPSSGQANRRSRRAEAVKDELRARGYNTGMYYHMD